MDCTLVPSKSELNSFGTPVYLTNGTDYVTPCDGYLLMIISGASGQMSLAINGVAMAIINGAYNRFSIFVKKGMTIQVSGSGGGGSFYPLS